MEMETYNILSENGILTREVSPKYDAYVAIISVCIVHIPFLEGE